MLDPAIFSSIDDNFEAIIKVILRSILNIS